MNREEIDASLNKQVELLKWEKEADYAQYQDRMTNISVKERAQNGVSWYPVRITNDFISTGE